MAYTDTIERLAKIVDHLAPIGQMSKGAPLRSDDWNALVSAVNDLAQLAIIREKGEGSQAAAEHEHIGQVDLSWFDPATQGLIEQHGGAPETAAELKRLDGGLLELRKIVTTLQAQLKALQLRMDAIDDGGRDRDGRLGRLELRVEATHDLRPELAKMDGRFAALGEKLTQAIKVKDQLIDHAGNPIDLPDVVKRLADVEDLRENLKAPDGTLVRYRDFDARLVDLKEAAVTRENLDDIISERLGSGGILENVSGGLLEIVKADIASRFEEVGGKLVGVESGIIDIGLQISKQGDGMDRLSGRVSVTETQLGRVGALETKIGDLGVRTNGVELTVQQHGNTLSGLKELPLELARLDTRLTLIEPLTRNVFALEQNLTVLDSKLFSVDSFDSRLRSVEDLSAQIAVTNERVAGVETGLSVIKTDFSTFEASASTFDSRISSVEGLSSQLATTTQRVGTLETQVKTATADTGTISASVSTFDTRLASVEGLSVQVASVDKRVGTVESQLSVATVDFGNLQTSVSTFDSRLSGVEGLSTQFATTTQRVGTLETQLKLATADTGKLQASVGTLGTRLTAVEGLSTQFASTNQRVGVLESQISVATANVTTLQTSVSGVSTRLKSVEGVADQLTLTTQRIGTLETKVTAATTDFTRLESRLKKIELTRPFVTPTGIPR